MARNLTSRTKAHGEYKFVATARRRQILDAAAACFRRAGFPGTSMRDISKTAGMCTSHIYHYFEHKQAIVEAVIEQGQSRGQVISDQINSFDDVILAILKISAEVGSNRDGVTDPALLLESFAEASRNSVAARILQDCDLVLQARLREVLKVGQAQGVVECGIDIDRLGLLVKAILYGSIVHMALFPDFDSIGLKNILCCAARALFVNSIRAPNKAEYQTLRQGHSLMEAHMDTLKVLGSAIAKRDSETGHHNYRVVQLCSTVGIELSPELRLG